MPQHRRVLASQDRDFHDAGQPLHAALRVLRCAQGRPAPIDFDEPRRVAEAVAALGLQHAVITSVNRDDDLMGGARAFALVIEEIRRQAPGCRIEVLIPDFQGNQEAIRMVVEARPEVLNHNTESVPRLYRMVRSGARYERRSSCCDTPKS